MRAISALMCASLLPTATVIAFILPKLSFEPQSLLSGILATTFSYCFCFAITILFGSPPHLLLKRFTNGTIWSYAASGFILSVSFLALPIYQDPTFSFFGYCMIFLSTATAMLFWFFNRPDLRDNESNKGLVFTFVGMLVIGALGFIILLTITENAHWLVNKDKCIDEGAKWNIELQICEYSPAQLPLKIGPL